MKPLKIVLLANEVEDILYEMYAGSEFAPGDILMTFIAQLAPTSWIDECCRGAAKTQTGNVVAYMQGHKTKEQLIEDLTIGKVTPIIISQVIDLADQIKGETQ